MVGGGHLRQSPPGHPGIGRYVAPVRPEMHEASPSDTTDGRAGDRVVWTIALALLWNKDEVQRAALLVRYRPNEHPPCGGGSLFLSLGGNGAKHGHPTQRREHRVLHFQ